MNRKVIKYMITSLVLIGCLSTISKTTIADTMSYSIKSKYGDRATLLFTDTDSLCYHIKNHNPYEVIAGHKDLFDLFAYPKSHSLFVSTNKKVVGKFKDEAVDGNMAYITEFVGLRSKLYSYSSETTMKNDKILFDEHHRCKGVKKSVIKNEMKTALYKKCLFDRQQHVIKQNGFSLLNLLRCKLFS